MLAEIKIGMVISVKSSLPGDNSTFPYFVVTCEEKTLTAYPLYGTTLPCKAFSIDKARVLEILGQDFFQYAAKIRNRSYLGTVCQLPDSHEDAVVTECCFDGTLKGVNLKSGELWETTSPVKVADSLYAFCKEHYNA